MPKFLAGPFASSVTLIERKVTEDNSRSAGYETNKDSEQTHYIPENLIKTEENTRG